MISRFISTLSRLPSSISSAFSSSNSSTTQFQEMSIKQFVDKSIADNKVIIFSKSWCPYCKKVKALFKNNFPNVKLQVVELDERSDGSSIQQYLHEKTGHSTVPSVFVNQQHVGGNDDTQAAFASKRLHKLIGA